MQDDFGQLRVRLQHSTKAPEFHAVSTSVARGEDTHNVISCDRGKLSWLSLEV